MKVITRARMVVYLAVLFHGLQFPGHHSGLLLLALRHPLKEDNVPLP